MKMRHFITTLILVTALCCSANAWAASNWYVHDFACDNCHKQGTDFQTLTGTVCLGCHATASVAGDGLPHLKAPAGTPTMTPSKDFSLDMASDAMGSRTASVGAVADGAGSQTSHNWSASDSNVAAGAQPPTDSKFNGRQNYSGAMVSCSRCHDPHGSAVSYTVTPYGQAPITIEANPKLLKLGVGKEDEMCVDCHRSWNTTDADAVLTHPMVSDYPAFEAAQAAAAALAGEASRYKPFQPNGDMVLDANNNITCTTCHGTHFTDSDGATLLDGAGQPLSQGDGRMLKGSGLMTGDAISLCTSCHVYKGHGTSNVGCIDCHSGHSYNDGAVNAFVLRSNVALSTWPADPATNPGTNLSYAAAGAAWKNAGGTGYCQRCHNTLPGTVSEHASLADGAGAGDASCGQCHKHYDVQDPTAPSFVASGSCDTCHGKPPVADVAGGPNGYAVNGGSDYSADPNYKNEANAAHAKHAGGTSPQYAFGCADCHAGNNHDDGNFQDVFLAPNDLSSGTGALAPTYVKAGDGTCSAVYCHSNGGPRAAVPTAATVPVWQNGGTVTCTSCHGNDAATMTTASNSTTHQKHLAKGYDCSVCHTDTATNATTLAAGAIQGTHVNGTADVTFDGSGLTQLNAVAGVYNADGTCQTVYCHSDGANNAPVETPDWDTATTGDCGSCHDVTGQNLPNAHSKHVFDVDGPSLACTTCHTNNGTGGDHVNEFVSMVASYQTAVCDSCHGVDGAETTPVWDTPASVDCISCHTGSALSTVNVQAPNKSLALTVGHNKTGGNYTTSGNAAANLNCDACHDVAAAGHFDGDLLDDRLVGGFDCTSCHGTYNTHQAKTCTTCHDPHGTSNVMMVQTSSADFSGTVDFQVRSGDYSFDDTVAGNAEDICATCHTAVTHNRADGTGGAHQEGNNCLSCHKPHTDPVDAFAVGAGTSCDGCHGFPPANAAHALHAPDAFALDALGVNNVPDTTDRSACAYCHTGADQYTYSTADDQLAGGDRGNHNLNEANQKDTLTVSVGYDQTDFNCTNACHASTLADGTWSDTALDCNACHYYATGAALTSANNTADANSLTGTHGTHFDSSATIECSACHVVPAADDTAHITTGAGTEIQKVTGRAQALQDEGAVLGTVGTDPAGAPEPNCNNAACHDPSGTGYSATWNTSTATTACDLCHSATDPTTKVHSAHLAAGAGAGGVFGADITCTQCHVDNQPLGTETSHALGSPVDVNGTEITTYTDSASTCTNNCHQDGVNAAPATLVNWDMAPQAPVDCTICHILQPATGSHAKHLTVAAGATCTNCHDTTVEGTSAAAQHLDLNLDVFNTVAADLGYPADKALATAGATCNAASCHTDGRNAPPVVTPIWGANSACVECHTTMTNNGPSTGGSHAAHMTTGMTSIACTSCHASATNPATDTLPSAAHRDGNVDTNAALEYGVTPFTNKTIGSAFTTCAAASCHDNGLGVAVTSPQWGVANNDCSACHLSQPGTGKHAIHLGHSSTAIPAIVCNDCHTGAVQGTTPPTTGHFDGNVDVVNGYPTNVAKGIASWAGTCSTASCHTDGQSGDSDSGVSGPSVVTTLAWNDAATCGACHVAVPTSAKHTSHLTLYGSTCGDCHATAGDGSAQPTANHLNNNIDVAASTNYTAAGAPGNGWGSCADPNTGCHGTTEARPWDSGAPVCNTCHGQSSSGTGEPLIGTDKESTLPLGQHNTHVNTEGMGCADCHDGGHFQASTQDDKIQISFTGQGAGGTYNPPALWTTSPDKWLYDQVSTTGTQDCSNLYCHSNGQAADGGNGALTYATPDWGNLTTGQCGTCHLGDGVSGDASTIATGSHTAHVVKSGASCDDCHLGNTHVNNALEVTSGTYTSAVLGNGYGTCSTASCHDDGTGALKAPTDTWGTSVTNCTECHEGVNMASGSHTVHLNAGATCTSCHDAATDPAGETAPSAGHRNGAIDTLAGLTYGNSTKGGAYATCATASCHVTNRNTAGLTPVWGGAAITDCTECHTTPPTGDTHNTHINANTNGMTGLTIGCTDCHDAATDVATQTPPTVGHKDGNIDAAGGYPAKLISDASYQSCNAAVCHQTGKVVNDYATTSNFNVDDANCTQCHTNAGLSPSHDKHIVSNDCSACHTGATKDTSYSAAAHGDGNVDVAVGGYTANKAYSNSTQESCASISCHSDGLSGTPGGTPVWGTAAGCAACHNDETVGNDLITGSHTDHLNSTIMPGITCAACHNTADPAGSIPPAQHTDGTVDVFASTVGDLGYPQDAAIGSGSWAAGTCNAASCHDNGEGGLITTQAWGTDITDCTQCHAGGLISTNGHNTHVQTLGMACATCHTGADLATQAPGANHLNSLVDVLFGYTDTTKGAPYGNCTTSCHGDGKSGAGTSPAWNGSIADCNACHLSTPAGVSHSKHMGDVVLSIGCGDCHTGATKDSTGGPAHVDGNVDVAVGGYTADKAYGAAKESCASISCHDDGTGTPAASTPVWSDGAVAACTACHAVAPTTGAHATHLGAVTNELIGSLNCANCHNDAVQGSQAPTGDHRDGNLDVYNSVPGDLGYPVDVASTATAYNTETCNTSYCHGDNIPTATSSKTGTTNAPTWGANNVDGCTFCHDMAPLAVGSHATAALTDCITCHGDPDGKVNGTGTGFTNLGVTHIDGTLDGGGDNCNDCHSSIGGVGNGPSDLSAAHAAHVTTAYVGKLSTNDYGNSATNGWYKYTSNAGVYDIGCGYCHPATVAGHTTRQVSLDPALDAANIVGTVKAKNDPAAAYAGLGGSCSGVYCHSDGVNIAAGASPNWSGGTIGGSDCAACHTNAPSTGAHSVHTVGIHYTDLYDSDRAGVMQAASVTNAAHGNAATATTITCALCHSTTVSVPQNDQELLCATCHDGTNEALKGDLAITGNGTHINGTADVQFNLAGFKTTAQLRDDITAVAELNTNWTRTNGYKQIAGDSHDAAKLGATYDGGGSCSAIVCHNGSNASWTDSTAGNCQKCHTELPQ